MRYFKWMMYLLILGGFSLGYSQETFFTQISNPWAVRLEGGYAVGRFIGLHENYAELGTFLAPAPIAEWQPFVDLRGYRLDNGDWAASGGLGVRWRDACFCRIWGANLFYDYRESCIGNFNRIGFGLESLGECWDCRLNVYIPVNGDTKRSCLCVFDDFIGPFLVTVRKKEFIFKGIDAEIGGHLWRWCNFSLYGAAGPYYYYHTHCDQIFGAQARLELYWLQYLSLEVRGSYDEEDKTNVQGKVMLRIPLDIFFCSGTACDPCRELLIQPVRRFGVIFTKHCCDWTWNW